MNFSDGAGMARGGPREECGLPVAPKRRKRQAWRCLGLVLWLGMGAWGRPAMAAAPADDAAPRLFRFMGGFGGGLGAGGPFGSTGPGAQLSGRALLQLGRISGDFGVREGLYTEDARSAGTLFFGARWTPPSPFSLRLGFAHHHEVPWAVLLAHPVGAAAGTAEGIRHRSGVELGGGWRAPLDRIWEPGRLGLGVEAAAAWLPDGNGPAVYGFVDLLLSIDLGRRSAS